MSQLCFQADPGPKSHFTGLSGLLKDVYALQGKAGNGVEFNKLCQRLRDLKGRQSI